MFDLVFKLPTVLVNIIALITFLIVGGFVIFNIFDKVKKQRIEETNKIDDRLIELLQKQVNALEKKVKELEELEKERAERILRIEARNEILEQVFQGRDTQTQEFQKQGFSAMQLAFKTHDLLNKTQEEVERNTHSIEKLYKAIEKHLLAMQEKV